MPMADDEWRYSDEQIDRAQRRHAQLLRVLLVVIAAIVLSVIGSAIGPIQFG